MAPLPYPVSPASFDAFSIFIRGWLQTTGSGGPPAEVQKQRPGGGSGAKVPQKLKKFAGIVYRLRFNAAAEVSKQVSKIISEWLSSGNRPKRLIAANLTQSVHRV